MKYQALRLFLWRWHRRLGLSAAILLIWLAVSGVLLNHTSFFDLAAVRLPVGLANSVYPVDYTRARILETKMGRVEQGSQTLRVNGQSIDRCDGQLVGAVVVNQELWIACENQIQVLGSQYQLLESFDKFSGLPTAINQVGSCSNSVCIESNQNALILDLATAKWQPYGGAIKWFKAVASDTLIPQLVPEIHNLERLILEAHSGRLFGMSGVVVMDLAAIAMLLLALSGCYVWWSHNRRRKLAKKRAASTQT